MGKDKRSKEYNSSSEKIEKHHRLDRDGNKRRHKDIEKDRSKRKSNDGDRDINKKIHKNKEKIDKSKQRSREKERDGNIGLENIEVLDRTSRRYDEKKSSRRKKGLREQEDDFEMDRSRRRRKEIQDLDWEKSRYMDREIESVDHDRSINRIRAIEDFDSDRRRNRMRDMEELESDRSLNRMREIEKLDCDRNRNRRDIEELELDRSRNRMRDIEELELDRSRNRMREIEDFDLDRSRNRQRDMEEDYDWDRDRNRHHRAVEDDLEYERSRKRQKKIEDIDRDICSKRLIEREENLERERFIEMQREMEEEEDKNLKRHKERRNVIHREEDRMMVKEIEDNIDMNKSRNKEDFVRDTKRKRHREIDSNSSDESLYESDRDRSKMRNKSRRKHKDMEGNFERDRSRKSCKEIEKDVDTDKSRKQLKDINDLCRERSRRMYKETEEDVEKHRSGKQHKETEQDACKYISQKQHKETGQDVDKYKSLKQHKEIELVVDKHRSRKQHKETEQGRSQWRHKEVEKDNKRYKEIDESVSSSTSSSEDNSPKHERHTHSLEHQAEKSKSSEICKKSKEKHLSKIREKKETRKKSNSVEREDKRSVSQESEIKKSKNGKHSKKLAKDKKQKTKKLNKSNEGNKNDTDEEIDINLDVKKSFKSNDKTGYPRKERPPPKTSDTYWNKYADKLGIRIEDPKENIDKSLSEKMKRSSSHSPERIIEAEKPMAKRLSIKKPVLDPLTTRTGGAYIPPARLKLMADEIQDKSSAAFQRLSWEALKKSINGLINKVTVSNISIIIRELLKENIVRGSGILCRALMQAQAFSQTFTNVYAAMAAVINSKFQSIGALLLKRLVIQFRRGYQRNDKEACLSSCRFIAHLINHNIAHEIVSLEILTMLLETAKNVDDTEEAKLSRNCSIELAIAFIKECGMKLTEVVPKGMIIIMNGLRDILHEGNLDDRYKFMIEVMFNIHKTKFTDFPAITKELDLIEEGDQFTHIIELGSKLDPESILNVFKHDPEYIKNEEWYDQVRESILGADEKSESGSDSGSESDGDSSSSDGEEENKEMKIVDMTESNLISFRRSVYLTIQSSIHVDEVCHKILKAEIKPGWHMELCNMIIDCCAQQRTYEKFYALIAGRFCQINAIYRECFENIFKIAYDTCHRLETERLRNISKLFSHILFSDNISWDVMEVIKLNQDETTSSSRVFLKIMFLELANFMGLTKLNERLRDPTMSHSLEGVLPRGNPVHTKFAINFFTTIGLGGLTDDLREFLRSVPKPTAIVAPIQKNKQQSSSSESSSSSSDDSDSSSSSSSDSVSSSSSSSDSDTSSSSSSDSVSSSSSSSDSDSSNSDSDGSG